MSKYGSESYSFEYRELQATTMSVDKNGYYALLAGRKYLAISNLEKNEIGQIQVRIPYDGKYEITNTQWSHLTNSTTFGIASSQRCDIFELTDGSELKRIYQLKAHSRVITDLDWSILSPNLLATSSFDSFLYVWDLRCPRDPSCERPQISLPALDGASQVTWNKWKIDCLASCDGGHVKIWDIRKPTSPNEYIAAHASKINGLEWVAKDMVITAAQDCTAKFSRLAASNPGKIKGPCLTLTTPIWRARPTPFGRGIVTQCVPLLRRDSGLLSLWNWQNFTSPIYTFQGHDIIEFAWKKSGVSDIVTWSRDQTLRLWSLPREVIELCGEDVHIGNTAKPAPLPTLAEDVPLPTEVEAGGAELATSESGTLSSSRRNGKPSPKRESSGDWNSRNSSSSVSSVSGRDELLNEEFDSIQDNISDHINIDQVDAEHGLLRFGWKPDPKTRSVSIVILVSFPINYPSSLPTFVVTSGGHDVDKTKLIKTMKHVAQSCVRKNEPCLSTCLNAFTDFMSQVKAVEETVNPYLFPSRGASNVPFPRTSGARFCSVGVLVCFGRPSYLKRVKSNCDAGTPRSLSALGPYLMQLTEESSMSTPHKSRRKKVEKKKAGLVTLFDVTPLLPLTKELASEYKHVSSLSSRKPICDANANIAKQNGKEGVAHTWSVCSVISDFTCSYNHAQPIVTKTANTQVVEEGQVVQSCGNSVETISPDDESLNWFFYHPLGSELIHDMITHYAKYGDVQTAAAIASQFTICASDEAAGVCNHGYPQPQLLRPTPVQEVSSWQSLSRSAHSQSQPWSISIGGPPQPRPVSRGGKRLIVPKWWTKGVGSPYHTVHGSDTMHGVTINPLSDNLFRQHRSNSWSDSLDDGLKLLLSNSRGYDGPQEESEAQGGYFGKENTNGTKLPMRGVMLDPTMSRTYDGYKKSYAEILYRWGQLQQRAEVLKCLTERSDETHHLLPSGVDYMTMCQTCKTLVHGANCSTCKRMTSTCSICHMPARGLCTFCIACGHGGHTSHMSQWFTTTRHMCPTGCGCQCVEENDRIFN